MSRGGPGATSLSDPGDTVVLPIVKVYARQRDGYTTDGNPLFQWSPVLLGPAVLWKVREEYDADAGFTRVSLEASVANTSGLTVLPESSILVEQDGTRWRITATRTTPAVIQVTGWRVDAAELPDATVDKLAVVIAADTSLWSMTPDAAQAALDALHDVLQGSGARMARMHADEPVSPAQAALDALNETLLLAVPEPSAGWSAQVALDAMNDTLEGGTP